MNGSRWLQLSAGSCRQLGALGDCAFALLHEAKRSRKGCSVLGASLFPGGEGRGKGGGKGVGREGKGVGKAEFEDLMLFGSRS